MARGAVKVGEDVLVLGFIFVLVLALWFYVQGLFSSGAANPIQALLDSLFGGGGSGVDSDGNAVGIPNLLGPHGTVNLPPIPGLWDQTGTLADGGSYDEGNY